MIHFTHFQTCPKIPKNPETGVKNFDLRTKTLDEPPMLRSS